MNNSNKNYGKYPIRRILIIDEAAVVVSFFISLILRYQTNVIRWTEIYDGLYISVILVLCLLQMLVFLLYDSRRKSVFEQDPAENLFSVIKGRVFIIVLLVIYLYLTQRGELSSRFVIGMVFVLDVLIDYAVRMLYRNYYNDKRLKAHKVNVLHLYPSYPSLERVSKYIKEIEYDEVLIHPGSGTLEYDFETPELTIEQYIKELENLGLRVKLGLNALDYSVRAGITGETEGYASIPLSIRREHADVFGVKYAVSGIEEAVLHVIRHHEDLSGKYICFSNVHTLVMARENKDYKTVLNNAAITFPDGSPIAQIEQRRGISGAHRVAGPDFMEHMFADTQDGRLSHYFYGSSQETLDALKESLESKYPGICIKGMYSPPYRELTDEEDAEAVRIIKSSGADLIWIGLGAPKQEKWMASHAGIFDGVMLGVGAGFDFHAGTIRRAPKWIQKIGLEWLYRLFQDPKRLISRYFVTNIKFYWYRLLEHFGIRAK